MTRRYIICSLCRLEYLPETALATTSKPQPLQQLPRRSLTIASYSLSSVSGKPLATALVSHPSKSLDQTLSDPPDAGISSAVAAPPYHASSNAAPCQHTQEHQPAGTHVESIPWQPCRQTTYAPHPTAVAGCSQRSLRLARQDLRSPHEHTWM